MKGLPPKLLILGLLFFVCLIFSNIHATSKGALNFVLITVDTLRRDHLSCYGNSTIRTPNIDSIANQGVVFDRFYTAANITMPSHLSIFSGTYPFHHGAYGNEPYRLPGEIPLLPAILRRNGYFTGGIAANSIFRTQWLHNFGEQFDSFYAPDTELPASEVSVRFATMLDSAKRRPFFFWIHYFDPHVPYRPPLLYRSLTLIQKGRPLPDLDFTKMPWSWLKADGVSTVDQANALYSGEILFVDEEIRKVWNLLRRKSLLADTIVVFVSDHGEMLGDHGVYYDHATLFNPTVHVPCIIYGKGFKAGRRQMLMSTIDIAPTILELAGVPIPSQMDGFSFLHSLMGGEAKKIHSYVYSVHAGRHGISVITDRFKFMRNFRPQYGQKERELYNLADDPLENRDLITSKPELAHAMEKLIPMGKTDAPIELTPEQAQVLKSLGYLQ
jgi:arylsulfatase A-like enzyme